MRNQYRLGFVDVGGWDTHVNQGSTTGVLANNLSNLGQGLAAYADALGDEWSNTTVVVSEFGRTFRENGDKGTDHGHGTVYWYPVHNYRDLLGGLLGRTWGLSGTQLQSVFSGARPNALELI
jgi:hypothetical protein